MCLLEGAVVLFLSGSAHADTLVHLNKMVWGCIDAQASSELNDEANPRRHDPVWVARNVARGRCVAISPKSAWEPASNDRNGMTHIDRRGTVHPESYWVPTSAIVFPAVPAFASRAPPATPNPTVPAQVQSQPVQSPASAWRDPPAAPASAPPPEGPSAPLVEAPGPAANAKQSEVGWELSLTAIVAVIVGAWLVHRSSRKKGVRGGTIAPTASLATPRLETGKAVAIDITPPVKIDRQAEPTVRGGKVVWHPPGVQARVAGYVIADGMVYLGSPENRYANEDGCVLDADLPVATSKVEPAPPLGYWPSYRSIAPACRRVYLDWLASGKRAPEIDVGYVFLYFYGLERRIFLDASPPPELVALSAEVERLRILYASSRSFDGYSRRLLEAVATLRDVGATAAVAFSPNLSAPAGEMPMMLKIAIAREVTSDRPLNFEMAAAGVIGLQEFAARHYVVLRSGRNAFLTVLRTRFATSFPIGFSLRNRKDSHLQLLYRGATAGLAVDLAKRNGWDSLPDPATLTWTKLLNLADAVATEIEPFVRSVARNPAKAESLAAFVACPTELAASTAVEARRWLDGLTSTATVAFSELARYATGDSATKWTIRHHRQVAETLKKVGRGMEPDPADGSERLENDTPVQVFKCSEAGSERTGNFDTAAAAAVLVAAVARSTNEQAEHVEARWLEQLPSRVTLTGDENIRLMARLKWLRNSSGGLAKTKRLLNGRGIQERQFCAWSGAAAVAATGTVTQQQVRMLEAIYDGLGVPRGSLYSTLHSHIASASPDADGPVVVADETPALLHPIPRPPTTTSPAAEEDRLAKIRAETERVSALLADIFVDEQAGPEPEPELESSAEDPFAGLDVAHTTLAEKLLSRSDWQRAEFEMLATKAGLMPDGAMETINEWAYERLGDALIEDGAVIIVHLGLLRDDIEPAAAAN
jgi:hypothetical protein